VYMRTRLAILLREQIMLTSDDLRAEEPQLINQGTALLWTTELQKLGSWAANALSSQQLFLMNRHPRFSEATEVFGSYFRVWRKVTSADVVSFKVKGGCSQISDL